MSVSQTFVALPANQRPFISLCFPAYNEGKTVYTVICGACSLALTHLPNCEIIVCDDGSTDNTASELQRVRETYPFVRLLRNDANRGLSFTFNRLYGSATGQYVFLNATDGQWPNEVILDLIRHAETSDIVISVRRDKHYSTDRNVISYIYNKIPELFFGVRTQDAGGVKLISRDFLYSGRLISRSPFADAERLIRAHRDGARLSFIEVDVKPRHAGKSHAVRFSVLLQCCLDVFRLFYEIQIRRYLSGKPCPPRP